MRKLLMPILLIIIICCVAHNVFAQTNDLLIDSVQVTENEPQVTIFFAVVDEQNQPVPAARVANVELEIWDANNQTTKATAEAVETEPPIYIVLAAQSTLEDSLLEGIKGSLGNLVEEREENVSLALISFAEAPALVQEFTDNPNLLVTAVDNIAPQNSRTTCLYDAVRFSRQEANKQLRENPAARAAVILIADGNDNEENTCTASEETIKEQNDDLVGRIPVYAWGPAGEIAQEIKLDELADETAGIMEAINPADLTGKYRELVTRLGSQWTATATLQTDAGEKGGVLLVTLEDEIRPLPAPIPPFTLLGGAPQLPSSFRLSSLKPDLAGGYSLFVEIGQPRPATQLFITLWDEANIVRRELSHTITIDDAAIAAGFSIQEIALGYAFMEDQEYRLDIEAKLADGSPIVNQEEEEVISHAFRHPAPVMAPLPKVAWRPPIIDRKSRQMIAELALEDTGRLVSSGRVLLVGGEDNIQVYEQHIAQPQRDTRVNIPLHGLPSGEYLLVYEMFDAEDQTLGEQASYTFMYRAPSIFTRAGWALREQWIISLLIVLTLLVPAGVWFKKRRRRPENPFAWASGPVKEGKPVTAGALNLAPITGAAPKTPREGIPFLVGRNKATNVSPLRVRLVQVDESEQEIKSQEFSLKQKIYIGRDGSEFDIQGDPDTLRQVSRQDVLLSIQDGVIYLTDKSRRKATYLNGQKLTPGKAYPILHSVATLRLGDSLAWVRIEQLKQ